MRLYLSLQDGRLREYVQMYPNHYPNRSAPYSVDTLCWPHSRMYHVLKWQPLTDMHSPISTGVTVILSPSARLMHAHGPVGLHCPHRPPRLDPLQSISNVPLLRLVRSIYLIPTPGYWLKWVLHNMIQALPFVSYPPLGFHWLCIPLGIFNYIALYQLCLP